MVKCCVIVIWLLKSCQYQVQGVCLFIFLSRSASFLSFCTVWMEHSLHPNTFKCIVYLQTVLNVGPGVFLNIQRNYKEQAWLHFHNWASLPSTTAWLAPSLGEIDSSVKAESCLLILWEVGEAHSLPSFSSFLCWRPIIYSDLKAFWDPSARCVCYINQSKCSLWAHMSVRADPWFEAKQPTQPWAETGSHFSYWAEIFL